MEKQVPEFSCASETDRDGADFVFAGSLTNGLTTSLPN
jgi:hypothetical protein